MSSSSESVGDAGGGGDATRALRDSNWAERLNGEGFREVLDDEGSPDVPSFGVQATELSESSSCVFSGEAVKGRVALLDDSLSLPFNFRRSLEASRSRLSRCL